ncbi:WecB/TagA/CpsF family glycosyltransferase [Alicyclobacillus sendaiensis]|uniref:N-acetylglucosaminyldiphosphoundecaprenol N-acetyl-beta-D-mannosaminyltransferase n=1 Tax=Alicyclobacillus sendaiensis PA2 TaxID=3029425 RepID=A0ABT6XV93_ALISE|nr:WecB/TagA/CpsF family glycosyltransferase [Alicyclobacillus sendaiensis]MDI9259014.1 WecB/TagA/CpsF family glycosyltransferase [Alicyclobacillus sendaiensis PA2]
MAVQGFAKDVVDVLGVRFHRITMAEAVEKILFWTGDGGHHLVVTAGPEFVMQCQRQEALLRLVNSADLVTADGIGVVWAARRQGRPVPERVTGVELVPQVLAEAMRRNQPLRVYLLGATEASLAACLEKLRAQYPAHAFEGHHGYFQHPDLGRILEEIRAFHPHLLLVGMGQPRQELFLRDVMGKLPPLVGMGVGGSIDVWGGTVRRAPEAFRRMNLEWLYRLITEPRRFRRQLALPKFALKVIASPAKREAP